MNVALPQAPEAVWRSALAEGRLLFQRAKASGTVIFPPRLAEPGTGDTDLEWIEATGFGTVYAVTLVMQKPPAAPDNVVLVDLDEQVRVMSRIDGVAPETITIGMRVKARIVDEDGSALLVFEGA